MTEEQKAAAREYERVRARKRRKDPDYRAKRRAYIRKRREDPEYVRKVREYSCAKERERKQHPEHRAIRAAQARERRKNPAYRARINEQRRDKRFGLAPGEWDSIYARQNGCCAICEKPFKRKRDAHTDHCHSTGMNRDLLCSFCNIRLGVIESDPELTKKLLAYSERHAARHAVDQI